MSILLGPERTNTVCLLFRVARHGLSSQTDSRSQVLLVVGFGVVVVGCGLVVC
jgi:hypothetical protein